MCVDKYSITSDINIVYVIYFTYAHTHIIPAYDIDNF